MAKEPVPQGPEGPEAEAFCPLCGCADMNQACVRCRRLRRWAFAIPVWGLDGQRPSPGTKARYRDGEVIFCPDDHWRSTIQHASLQADEA